MRKIRRAYLKIRILMRRIRRWIAVARQEWRTEKRQKAEFRRLEKQMEIGYLIYYVMFWTTWEVAGMPADKKISRNSNFSGAYQITIGQEKVAEIIVDLRWPKDQQIFISCEYFGVFSGRSRFDVFSVLDGKKFIREKLVPAIFPPS